MEDWKSAVLVGSGGFLGSSARYLVAVAMPANAGSGFPIGTFVVNLLGSFLIGIVMGLFAKELVNENWRLFLATGILGGFTTYSAFSSEVFRMLASKHFAMAATYCVGTTIFAIAACAGGAFLSGFRVSSP